MVGFTHRSPFRTPLGIVALFVARSVGAQGLEVVYEAPVGCPNASQFKTQVEQSFAGSTDALKSLAHFQVTIQREGEAFRVSVKSQVEGVAGARTLSAPECGSVADAAALFIAMALDSSKLQGEQAAVPGATDAPFEPPSAATLGPANADSALGSAPLPPESSLDPAPQASLSERAAEPSAPAAAAEPTGSPHTSVALLLAGDIGSLPSLAPGLRIDLGRSSSVGSLRLGLIALNPSSEWVDGRDGGRVGGRFWLGAGRAEGCLALLEGTLGSLEGCLVIEAGALTGSGLGVDVAKRETLLWLSPAARVVGSVPLISDVLSLRLGAEALTPIRPSRFTVEQGQTQLHSTANPVWRLDLGAEWRFR